MGATVIPGKRTRPGTAGLSVAEHRSRRRNRLSKGGTKSPYVLESQHVENDPGFEANLVSTNISSTEMERAADRSDAQLKVKYEELGRKYKNLRRKYEEQTVSLWQLKTQSQLKDDLDFSLEKGAGEPAKTTSKPSSGCPVGADRESLVLESYGSNDSCIAHERIQEGRLHSECRIEGVGSDVANLSNRAQIEQTKQVAGRLQQEKSEFESKKCDQSKVLADEQALCADLEAEVSKLKAELLEGNEDLKSMANTRKTLEASIKQLKDEQQLQQQSLQAERLSFHRTQQDRDSLVASQQEMNGQIRQLIQSRSRCRSEVAKLESERIENEAKLNDQKALLAEMDSALESERQLRQQLKEQVEQQCDLIEARRDQFIAEMEKERSTSMQLQAHLEKLKQVSSREGSQLSSAKVGGKTGKRKIAALKSDEVESSHADSKIIRNIFWGPKQSQRKRWGSKHKAASNEHLISSITKKRDVAVRVRPSMTGLSGHTTSLLNAQVNDSDDDKSLSSMIAIESSQSSVDSVIDVEDVNDLSAPRSEKVARDALRYAGFEDSTLEKTTPSFVEVSTHRPSKRPKGERNDSDHARPAYTYNGTVIYPKSQKKKRRRVPEDREDI